MLRHLGESAPRVVFAVDGPGIGITIDLRDLPTESKCEIAVLVPTFRVQEIDDLRDINGRTPDRNEGIPGNCNGSVEEQADAHQDRCFLAVSVQQRRDQHARKRQCKQQGPEAESLEGEHVECPAEQPSRHGRRSTKAEEKGKVIAQEQWEKAALSSLDQY